MSPLAEQAKAYARRGWRVLPLCWPVNGACACGRKHPKTGEPWPHTGKDIGKAPAPAAPNGFKNATTSLRRAEAWWGKTPSANIGIATGARSGLIILDVDPRNGGTDSLERLRAKYGPLPDTVQVLTGSGEHYYFKSPKGTTLHSKLEGYPGLDIKSEGGHVIGAGSLHANGRRYEFEASSHPDDIPLAECPPWLLELAAKPREVTLPTTATAKTVPLGKAALDFVANGAPKGQQRGRAVAAGRNYLSAGHAPEQAVDALMRAFDASPQDAEDPWTREHAESIIGSLLKTPAPPLPELHVPPSASTTESRNGHLHGETIPPKSNEPFRFTDLGNAERFAHLHQAGLRYVYQWKSWVAWDGKRWSLDGLADAERAAHKTVRSIYDDAEKVIGDTAQEKMKAWALKSEAAGHLDAILRRGRALPGISAAPSGFDRTDWKLNLLNGTLDLRAGELLPHDPNDMITKLAPLNFDRNAACPLWEATLERNLAGRQDIITFLQRAAGYSLTGAVWEHVFFFLYGLGRNGKSTFIETLLAMLGDYAMEAAPDLLMSQGENNQRHPTERADLYGKRLVVCVESESGRRLSEGFVKQATGGDRIRARRMHQDFFEFDPTHKLFLVSNYRPIVKGTDEGIWSRPKLVHFNVTIPKEERDPQLKEKLRKEWPGILNWALKGCLEWQEEGLAIPEEVEAATKEYRDEMNPLADFIADCCELLPTASVSNPTIREAYDNWCETNKEKYPLGPKQFAQRLATLEGVTPGRVGKERNWHGIGVKLRERDEVSPSVT
jgi:putative DNA primase/helicase